MTAGDGTLDPSKAARSLRALPPREGRPPTGKVLASPSDGGGVGDSPVAVVVLAETLVDSDVGV